MFYRKSFLFAYILQEFLLCFSLLMSQSEIVTVSVHELKTIYLQNVCWIILNISHTLRIF